MLILFLLLLLVALRCTAVMRVCHRHQCALLGARNQTNIWNRIAKNKYELENKKEIKFLSFIAESANNKVAHLFRRTFRCKCLYLYVYVPYMYCKLKWPHGGQHARLRCMPMELRGSVVGGIFGYFNSCGSFLFLSADWMVKLVGTWLNKVLYRYRHT